MPTKRLRKSPRLKDFDYRGPLAAHLVFVTRLREPVFASPALANIAIDALNRASVVFKATLHAYCVMPNHIHVLIEISEGVSLEEFAKRFKQLAGFQIKQVTGEPFWQTSFYDHVIRREEDLTDVAAYIWYNPIEAGMAEHYDAYPFSGPVESLRDVVGYPARYTPPRSFDS